MVIGLLGVLATLTAIYIAPAFQDNKNVIRGLDRVTTTLLIAKQRALRDQGIRGVRLLANANGQVSELQLIEQPSQPYRQGLITASVLQSGRRVVTFSGVDFFGGAAAGNVADYNVGPGDYIRFGSSFTTRARILAVPATNRIEIRSTAALTVTNPQTAWEILRKPRPIAGEDTIALPENVIIDLRQVEQAPGGMNHRVPPVTLGTTTLYDILFDPAGGMVNAGSRTIVLWVRDATSQDPVNERDRSRLLSIHPRTGAISAHEVGTATNPLQFATDGRSSGL